MSDEIFFDGVRYISASHAAEYSDFTRDYVARLCRDGKVRGRRVGKNWYVDNNSLSDFLLSQEYSRGQRRESLAAERAQEYRQLNSFDGKKPGSNLARTTSADSLTQASAHTSPVVPVVAAMREKLSDAATHHPAIIEGAGRALASHAGLTDAAFRAVIAGQVHIPAYTVTPVAEFLHKLVALSLAFMMRSEEHTSEL